MGVGVCDLFNEANYKHFKQLGALCEGSSARFLAMMNFKIYSNLLKKYHLRFPKVYNPIRTFNNYDSYYMI